MKVNTADYTHLVIQKAATGMIIGLDIDVSIAKTAVILDCQIDRNDI